MSVCEASHGTQEFYRERARLTSRLIDAGFDAVAIEGDWPDALRVDHYVRGDYAAAAAPGFAGLPPDDSARAALRGFRRFPSWMWRNTVVADWLEWLRARNGAQRFGVRRAGFYGLDLYSMQFVTEITGPVREEVLRASLEAMLERHPNLRVSLWDTGVPHPVQIVPASVVLRL